MNKSEKVHLVQMYHMYCGWKLTMDGRSWIFANGAADALKGFGQKVGLDLVELERIFDQTGEIKV